MWAIYKREFSSYFHNVYGPIYVGVMFLFGAFFTMLFNYGGGSSGFEYTVNYFSMALLVLVPVLSMRCISEEKKNGTIQLLYALPLKMRSIVLGKYLALLSVTGIPILAFALFPVILANHGQVYFVKAYIALLLLFLLGAALCALCMFISSLTESLVVSAVVSIASCLLLYFLNLISVIFPKKPIASLIALCVVGVLVGGVLFLLTRNILAGLIGAAVIITPTAVVYLIKASLFENLFSTFLSKIALFALMNNSSYGTLSLSTILIYLSFIVFFVFLTIQSLEKKRYL